MTSHAYDLKPALIAASVAAALLVTACAQRSPEKRPLTQEVISNSKSVLRTDSDMQTVLNKYASFDPKAVEKITPAEARKQPTIADAVTGVLKDEGRSTDPAQLVPGVTSVDRTITGATGPLPARIYTPAGKGPFPVVVYFHGGGWVFADHQVYDGGARALSKQANAIVISVDYRLAPENKFPAAHDDALAAYRWAISHARSLHGDSHRLALAGESAGGNLAVATAVAVHQAGLRAPRHVLAIYPVAQNNTHTASYDKYADAKPLNRPMMLWFIDKISRGPADVQDARIDLVKADLRGLPPVTIINAEIDPLRDDGAELQTALQKAGVSVERKVYDGVTHEFFGTGAVVAKAKQAQAYAGDRLKADFSRR